MKGEGGWKEMCFKAREELIARNSSAKRRGIREEEVMLVVGGSCEKDLRLAGTVPQTRGVGGGRGEVQNELSEK